MSVEPRPAATTLLPCAVAPREKASASGAEEVRMSCMMTIAAASVSRTNAAPVASATSSPSSSGTMPRMSYALKIFARSVIGSSLWFAASATVAMSNAQSPSLPSPATLGFRGFAGLRFARAARGTRRRRPQHAQVAAAAYLDPLTDGLFGGLRSRGLPDRVRQCLQVVVSRLRGLHRQPNDLPAQRRGQPLGVRRAQIVTVRLHVGGERPEHGGRVAVDIGEGADSGLLARGAGATTGTHLLTSLGPPRSLRWHRPYPAPAGRAITSGTLHVRVLGPALALALTSAMCVTAGRCAGTGTGAACAAHLRLRTCHCRGHGHSILTTSCSMRYTGSNLGGSRSLLEKSSRSRKS